MPLKPKTSTDPQDEICFDASDTDRELIDDIVARAESAGLVFKNYDSLTCRMDVTAAHLNGNPLRLADLLDADDFNFTHDICGIAACLDRGTGRLTKNFRPRFSVPTSCVEDDEEPGSGLSPNQARLQRLRIRSLGKVERPAYRGGNGYPRLEGDA